MSSRAPLCRWRRPALNYARKHGRQPRSNAIQGSDSDLPRRLRLSRTVIAMQGPPLPLSRPYAVVPYNQSHRPGLGTAVTFLPLARACPDPTADLPVMASGFPYQGAGWSELTAGCVAATSSSAEGMGRSGVAKNSTIVMPGLGVVRRSKAGPPVTNSGPTRTAPVGAGTEVSIAGTCFACCLVPTIGARDWPTFGDRESWAGAADMVPNATAMPIAIQLQICISATPSNGGPPPFR